LLYKYLNTKKKLPYIKEIITKLYFESKADYFIYTNADIGLSKNFYEEVYKLIKKTPGVNLPGVFIL